MAASYEIRPIGVVRSDYGSIDEAPRQGREKGDVSLIELFPEFAGAAEGLESRDRLIVITWMDRADRGLVRIVPRGIEGAGATGVLNTRTPNRPNPLGIGNVELVSVSGITLKVRGLDCIDGTPVVDIKPFIPELDG